MNRYRCLLFLLLTLFLPPVLADEAVPGGTFKDLQILGEVTVQGGDLVVKSKSATFVIAEPAADAYRVTAELALAAKGTPVLVQAMPADAADLKKPAVGRVSIARDPAGRALTASTA